MFLRFLKKDKNRHVGLDQFYSSIFLRACIIYYKYYNTEGLYESFSMPPKMIPGISRKPPSTLGRP